MINSKNFRFLWLIITIIIAAVLYIVYSHQKNLNSNFEKSIPLDTRCNIGVLREEIFNELVVIREQLNLAKTQNLPPQLKTLKSLEHIMRSLDASYASHKTTTPTTEVCPEVYTNTTYGWPLFETGWINPCGEVSLDNLLTVILFPQPVKYADCSTHTSWILTGLQKYYPSVNVIIVNLFDKCLSNNSHKKTQIFSFTDSESIGEILNQVVSRVKTPYVFIGKDMNHFNQFVRFERQISVFSIDPKVQIVSGAIRNISGHWKVGCFQSEMKNYFLQYLEGYQSSKNECMFCDHVIGPFIAKTDMMKNLSFDNNLPLQVLFGDFFLRVRNSGGLILNCPDVMYFSSAKESVIKKHWLPLALKWQLNYIIFPTKTRLKFSCQELKISCKLSDKLTKTHTMPLCCRDEYVKGFQMIKDLSEKYNFKFELDSGSVVGAVKMRGVLPWDVDGDTVYLSYQHEIIAGLKTEFEKNGLKLQILENAEMNVRRVHVEGGYMILWTSDQSIEMYGMDTLSNVLLPFEFQNVSTKVELNGLWFPSPANPGLFVRNRYGVECLRHAHHWRQAGKTSSWELYESGKFNTCPQYGHHACLDRFPADGNLQFVVP